MTTNRNQWQNLGHKLLACLRDDRGVAMTEYLIITAVTIPLIIFLFHPDNGFYKAARDHFDLTTLLLSLPGP